MNDPMSPRIVFYSSRSENTLRFVNKLHLPSVRLPVSRHEPLPEITNDYILIAPTYGAGKTMGAVPIQVRRFLNEDPIGRKHCVGVIGSGNTSYGRFATSVDLISEKLKVPALYKFEVFGMPEDVTHVHGVMLDFFPELSECASMPEDIFELEGKFMRQKRFNR